MPEEFGIYGAASLRLVNSISKLAWILMCASTEFNKFPIFVAFAPVAIAA